MTDQIALIVDDDTTLAVLLAQVLETKGWTTLVASGFEAAMTATREQTAITVAICDIELGTGPNGVELAASIRRLRPKLPIVIITGHREDMLSRLMVDPTMPVLFKPFDVSELTRVILEVSGDG